MTRLARTPDSDVARFLDTWDTLDASEQQGVGAADAVCERVGLAPTELLKTAAGAACRVSMYEAQIIAAALYPAVVQKTIDCALTDKGFADRAVLHKAMGFLPMPKGSQTAIAIMQTSHASASTEARVVAPSPEETIRRLQQRFNGGLGHAPAPRIPRPAAPTSR